MRLYRRAAFGRGKGHWSQGNGRGGALITGTRRSIERFAMYTSRLAVEAILVLLVTGCAATRDAELRKKMIGSWSLRCERDGTENSGDHPFQARRHLFRSATV